MKTQTVELTSKALKLQYLIAVAFWVAGPVAIFIGINSESATAPVIGGVVAVVIGAFWLIVTKIRIWWNHK